MGIKRHIKHYQVETIIDSNGKEKKEICYTGMYLCPVYIEQEIRKQRNICLGFTIVMIAFFFLAAFLNTMGTRQIWIAIPFASLVLPFIYLVMGNISLFYWKEKLEQPLVENSKGRIEKTTIAIVILEVVVVITNIFFIVSKNFNRSEERRVGKEC